MHLDYDSGVNSRSLNPPVAQTTRAGPLFQRGVNPITTIGQQSLSKGAYAITSVYLNNNNWRQSTPALPRHPNP